MLIFLLAFEKAKDFSLKGLDGKEYKLSNFRGKVVVLDFWATWCPPCRASLSFFENIHKKYKDKGLVVVGVSVDMSDRVVKKFVESKGLTYLILLDKDNLVSDLYNVFSIPTTIIIDKNGNIVTRKVGFNKSYERYYEETVKKLLEERCESYPC
jgi:Peroxiredoxin